MLLRLAVDLSKRRTIPPRAISWRRYDALCQGDERTTAPRGARQAHQIQAPILYRGIPIVIKRACDIAVASIGLVLLSPLLLLLAVAIKVSSPGPVFYRGERIGRYGQPFRIFKFRSMVVDAEKLGGSSSGDDDPRITPIGRFMRKCKLDELPQLINVLLGDMSMVGPRPEVARFVAMYTPEERVILTIRPGITDWASLWNSDEGAILAGAEDPDQAYLELIRPTKIRLQLKYVEERSLGTDMRILVLTVLRLLQKDRIPEEIRSLCQ